MQGQPLCNQLGAVIADVADQLSAHTNESFLEAHPMPVLISQGPWSPGESGGESTRVAAGARYRTPSGAPTIADEIFGKQPISESLNERLELLGYTDMTPLDEIGTVSVLFSLWAFGIALMLICYCGSCLTGSMCCRRCGLNL